jgi:hypothetical protein
LHGPWIPPRADREILTPRSWRPGAGAGALLQYYLQGFDTPNNRPRSFLGHYMTASGLSMCVLCLAAARLAFWRDSTAEDLCVS